MGYTSLMIRYCKYQQDEAVIEGYLNETVVCPPLFNCNVFPMVLVCFLVIDL